MIKKVNLILSGGFNKRDGFLFPLAELSPNLYNSIETQDSLKLVKLLVVNPANLAFPNFNPDDVPSLYFQISKNPVLTGDTIKISDEFKARFNYTEVIVKSITKDWIRQIAEDITFPIEILNDSHIPTTFPSNAISNLIAKLLSGVPKYEDIFSPSRSYTFRYDDGAESYIMNVKHPIRKKNGMELGQPPSSSSSDQFLYLPQQNRKVYVNISVDVNLIILFEGSHALETPLSFQMGQKFNNSYGGIAKPMKTVNNVVASSIPVTRKMLLDDIILSCFKVLNISKSNNHRIGLVNFCESNNILQYILPESEVETYSKISLKESDEYKVIKMQKLSNVHNYKILLEDIKNKYQPIGYYVDLITPLSLAVETLSLVENNNARNIIVLISDGNHNSCGDKDCKKSSIPHNYLDLPACCKEKLQDLLHTCIDNTNPIEIHPIFLASQQDHYTDVEILRHLARTSKGMLFELSTILNDRWSAIVAHSRNPESSVYDIQPPYPEIRHFLSQNIQKTISII